MNRSSPMRIILIHLILSGFSIAGVKEGIEGHWVSVVPASNPFEGVFSNFLRIDSKSAEYGRLAPQIEENVVLRYKPIPNSMSVISLRKFREIDNRVIFTTEIGGLKLILSFHNEQLLMINKENLSILGVFVRQRLDDPEFIDLMSGSEDFFSAISDASGERNE